MRENEEVRKEVGMEGIKDQILSTKHHNGQRAVCIVRYILD